MYMKNKVDEYRCKQNMTLQQLSERTGISRTTLSKIVNNQTNDILLSHAITLSRVLKVNLYELFCIQK
jgi:DNA-binding XRE family transcriptional regulator|nr:MAG TPA: Helix-turn-helix XRE-family like protein [Caudoviricetes sp.]DAN90566.1 MAG TPA: Helix-turn-helix XRE-family like protein [Bacteriophage sp.]DAF71015.1 MAG TPA: helix-turn-helix XRE-family like protein [Caudoviricetes sp.]DAL62418.1 MAG TPA_asm: Helix-turn-helix XRE-family like protein [Caudoviricetes sp.]DAO35823.1 MAG TPA: Helix-turn-helix XRE-family like protein [Caudoviricetes sp.]